MISCTRRSIIRLLFAVCFSFLTGSLAAAAGPNPLATGPESLVLLYRCPPSKRTAFRSYLASSGSTMFSRWQKQGIYTDHKILFSRYPNSDNWDAVVFLTFADYKGVSAWNRIERSYPSGLSPVGLGLISDLATYSTDTLAARATPSSADSSRADRRVYLVVPYLYQVPEGKYVKYVHGYVLPQLDGWMSAGVLSSYHSCVFRYSAGRPWNALLLLGYKDDAALGLREKTVADVRAQLMQDPAWRALSESKQNIRMEKAAIIADELP